MVDHSGPPAHSTHSLSVTKINLLMLYRKFDMISTCCTGKSTALHKYKTGNEV